MTPLGNPAAFDYEDSLRPAGDSFAGPFVRDGGLAWLREPGL